MSLVSTFRGFIATLGDLQISNNTDTQIDFSTGGLFFLFIPDEDDHYFRLFLPQIDNYRPELSEKLNQYNMNYKAGKAIVYNNTVWFVFEHFIQDYERDGSFIFARALSVLRKMMEDWRRQ